MSAPRQTPELRLSHQERANVLRVMETRHSGSPPCSHRLAERVPYEPGSPPMIELAGAPGPLVVVGRNLSSGGMAFLHGGPVDPGTRCSVTLFDPSGAPGVASASVIRCDKIAGRIHDIGVKFDEPIDAARFVSHNRPAPLPAGAPGGAASGALDRVPVLREVLQRLRALEEAGWPEDQIQCVIAEMGALCKL